MTDEQDDDFTLALCKVSSGELIIGEIIEETEDGLVLLDTLRIDTVHTPRPKMMSYLWFPFVSDGNIIHINKNQIVAWSLNYDEWIEDYYLEVVEKLRGLGPKDEDDEEVMH